VSGSGPDSDPDLDYHLDLDLDLDPDPHSDPNLACHVWVVCNLQIGLYMDPDFLLLTRSHISDVRVFSYAQYRILFTASSSLRCLVSSALHCSIGT